MHYKNGRAAKNGDKVILVGNKGATPIAGTALLSTGRERTHIRLPFGSLSWMGAK